MDLPRTAPMPEPPPIEPGVYLVGTPIGNLEDITLRALRVLAAAEALACEDTRVTRKIFQRHGLSSPRTIFALNDRNERQVADRLVRAAANGAVAAFCSDAGMPGISDPGFNLARAARAAGVRLEVIPGPSAVVTAIALAGIPAASFTFLGFPSRRDGRVKALLAAHGALPPAMVLYESPRRLGRLMGLAAEAVGADRQVAVCLELTKKFERVERGSVGELAGRFQDVEVRGEATVVIAGSEKKSRKPDRDGDSRDRLRDDDDSDDGDAD